MRICCFFRLSHQNGQRRSVHAFVCFFLAFFQCWAQVSSQNDLGSDPDGTYSAGWAVVPTRAWCGLRTLHTPLNCFASFCRFLSYVFLHRKARGNYKCYFAFSLAFEHAEVWTRQSLNPRSAVKNECSHVNTEFMEYLSCVQKATRGLFRNYSVTEFQLLKLLAIVIVQIINNGP